jgi:tetratricopeptide repeat protein
MSQTQNAEVNPERLHHVMPTDQTERLANLVASALECALSERAQFLSDVCGDDVALRREAEALLRFENNARDFIETPAYEVAADEVLNGVGEPAEAPIPYSEPAVESGPELQSPEIEPRVREEIISKAPPEKPKPEWEPPSQLPAKTRNSFRVPTFTAIERVPSRPVEFVWVRRALLIALAVIVVAILIGLNSALREAKNARRQRDLAQAEQSRTERINNFLQRILYSSDRSSAPVWPVAHKKNIPVTDMLDRIAPQVQSELADQPDLRGEVLRRIGAAYASQGDHDAAEKNLRAALQAQTAFYKKESAQVIETMIELGALLYRREKFSEAEGFLEKGATFLRKLNQTEGGRANAVTLAYVLDQLGAVKFYRGDVKAGRAILEEALQVATQAQPKERDRSVLTNIKTDLGGLLVLLGELRKGETLLQESLAESRALGNARQWETGITLQMLGELALARNRPRQAEDNLLAAEEIFRETLGEKNLYFARNLERRATVSLVENDLLLAEQLAQRSLAITKESSPDNKLPWTDSMATLSDILIKEGRAAEGEDYLRETIRICEEQPTRNYAAIALAKIRLSQLFLSQERYTESENVAFEAHSETQQHLEPQDPMRKATANNLIQIYEVQEKHHAANGVK